MQTLWKVICRHSIFKNPMNGSQVIRKSVNLSNEQLLTNFLGAAYLYAGTSTFRVVILSVVLPFWNRINKYLNTVQASHFTVTSNLLSILDLPVFILTALQVIIFDHSLYSQYNSIKPYWYKTSSLAQNGNFI